MPVHTSSPQTHTCGYENRPVGWGACDWNRLEAPPNGVREGEVSRIRGAEGSSPLGRLVPVLHSLAGGSSHAAQHWQGDGVESRTFYRERGRAVLAGPQIQRGLHSNLPSTPLTPT